MGFEELRIQLKEALYKSFLTKDIEELACQYAKANCSDTDKKAAMDQAFRDKLLTLIVDKPESLEDYVTFCIEACRKHMVTATMPVVLLGDIFDALTLDKCEKMFAYVEKGVSIWKEEIFFVACKNNLLRMCNDLLRRLSRSQNTVFCGRILLFLAKFFPFSERSGLNIVSEFNLENVTEFGGDNSSNLKEVLEEEVVVDDGKNKLNIDYNLYCKFWALQDFFRNPNSCYNKLQWKTFVAHSSCVLSAFGSYKLEAVQLQKPELNRVKPVLDSTGMEVEAEGKESHYFAKFLTNQKLLELQLSDSNFRRCVLVQFLILFQYLNSQVKFKVETQELRVEQSEWVRETGALVYRLLGETPPSGEQFARAVRHILAREDHWNHWKNDGCPEFVRPRVGGAGGAAGGATAGADGEERGGRARKRRRPLGDTVRDYDATGKIYMGNGELTKLWNLCPDNLAACRAPDRDFMPSLESYLGECGAGAGAGGAGAGGGGWGWRALRLLARRSPHFFTHTNNPIGRLQDYLDDMVRRVVRELPSAAGAAGAAGAQAAGDGAPADKAQLDQSQEAQEAQEEEMTEEQMEADLIKNDDTTEMEQVEGGGGDDVEKSSRSRLTLLTSAQIEAVAAALDDGWRRLAAKLGYKPDEIQYFESEHATEAARAAALLRLWCDEDEDASAEGLRYVCEGLELRAACSALDLSTAGGAPVAAPATAAPAN